MKKIFLLLSILMAALPAFAVDLTGTMTSYTDEAGTKPAEGCPWDVTATYDNSTLSITGFGGEGWGPIVFTVNESSGDAVGKGGQTISGAWTFTGGSSNSENVNAIFSNIGGFAVLTIKTWYVKKSSMPGYGAEPYYNTEIVFDQAIEALPGGGTPDPENPLNGEWLFNLTCRDAMLNFGTGEYIYDATAYTNGDVEFAWRSNQATRLPNIKGKFDAETGKITFSTTPTGVAYNDRDLYYQVPVLYNVSSRTYKIQEVTATYDGATQTITFPANTGFIWFTSPDTSGTPRISTVEYKSAKRDVPTITITSLDYVIDAKRGQVVVTVKVEVTKGYGRIPYVYYYLNGTPQLESQKAPVIDGVTEITISGLRPGETYDYNFIAKVGDIQTEIPKFIHIEMPIVSTDPANPNGQMTDFTENNTREQWKVKGTVNGTKLSIENFAGYNENVEFNIDLASGIVQSTKDQTLYDGYYFSHDDFNIVYGRMANISKTQSKLTIYPWRLYKSSMTPGFDYIKEEYTGGEIIFDFTVDGLLEEIPAKSIINGDWTFTVTDHSDFSDQLKNNKISYKAQLFESGVVKFTCATEMSPKGYDFYGTFNPENNALTLSQTPLLVSIDNKFVYQLPIFFSASENKAQNATVIAHYENDTFAFETNGGMAWLAANTLGGITSGVAYPWIWTFNEAKQITHADTEPGTNGIEEVEGVENVNVRYFDLQGIEIANPVPGNIYIRVQGNKATKVVVK